MKTSEEMEMVKDEDRCDRAKGIKENIKNNK